MKTTKRKTPTTKKVVKKNKDKVEKNNSVTYEAISIEAWEWMNE
jgi:hypothetical protein